MNATQTQTIGGETFYYGTYFWLYAIKEILDDPQPDAMDFLDAIKLNLYASEIFVFTPKGEIKTMPQGCTALDFAFSIHSVLGTHCIGAKVNHKLVPMNHVLQSGDQVEILTSNSQHVQASWLSFATTAKARAKIQAALRRQQRLMQNEGEEKLNAFLEKEGLGNYIGNIEKLLKEPSEWLFMKVKKVVCLMMPSMDHSA